MTEAIIVALITGGMSLLGVVATCLATSKKSEKNQEIAQAVMRTELEELTRLVDRFLRDLPEKECCIFLRRYWYCDSIEEISRRYGIGQSKVKTSLHRTRGKLKAFLAKEGIAV